MKYIAVLLAILSAGSAWGGELINYVPISLDVRGSYYKGPTHPVVEHTAHVAAAEPHMLSMVFNDKPGAKRPLNISAVRNIYEGLENGDLTVSGPNGPQLRINDNFSMDASYVPGYRHFDKIPYRHDNLSDVYLPSSSSSESQSLNIICNVPQNIKGSKGAEQLKLGASILLIPKDNNALTEQRSIVGECTWHLRAIYSLSLTLEKTVMSIVDKVGSTTIHNNKLHVSGNGGAVLITIDNPAQDDINTSFSDTNPNVLTTTTTPTAVGTTVPFYVAVKNTRAGSRTYNVNFTAAYI